MTVPDILQYLNILKTGSNIRFKMAKLFMNIIISGNIY